MQKSLQFSRVSYSQYEAPGVRKTFQMCERVWKRRASVAPRIDRVSYAWDLN